MTVLRPTPDDPSVGDTRMDIGTSVLIEVRGNAACDRALVARRTAEQLNPGRRATEAQIESGVRGASGALVYRVHLVDKE